MHAMTNGTNRLWYSAPLSLNVALVIYQLYEPTELKIQRKIGKQLQQLKPNNIPFFPNPKFILFKWNNYGICWQGKLHCTDGFYKVWFQNNSDVHRMQLSDSHSIVF